MKIYFAGSIRGGRDDSEIYFQIIELLGKYGQVLAEHIGSKDLTDLGEVGMTSEEIYQRDMAWLKECDTIVAEVSTPSLGVGYEIGRWETEKPIICLYRKEAAQRISSMIIGNKNILAKEYKNIAEVKGILDKFFVELKH